MTKQENNKLIEYLIKHDYNKLDTLRDNDIYTKKTPLARACAGLIFFHMSELSFMIWAITTIFA